MSKTINGLIIGISVFLVIVLIIVSILMFPLKGKTYDYDYWYRDKPYDINDTIVLEKEENKDFKILVITDLQFNDALDLCGKADNVYETVDTLVTKQKPDLIVITGDLVWAKFTKFSVIKAINKIDSYGIPWAPINGNHDGEGNVDLAWIANKYEEAENCLFKQGPDNIGGIGNYIINIRENDKIVQSLIMMDTHASRYYDKDDENRHYDFIYDSQIEWYKWAINGINEYNKTKTDSMLFIHIPLPEFKTAYDLWQQEGGAEGENFGVKGEEECPSYINTGMFNAIKEFDSTKYVFAGHDHLNNYSVMYEGVRLTYAMKTGDRCNQTPGQNGGTLITMGDKITVEHIYVEN